MVQKEIQARVGKQFWFLEKKHMIGIGNDGYCKTATARMIVFKGVSNIMILSWQQIALMG
jgi:hypothetical protein